MNAVGLVAFNLLLNAVGSFTLAWLVVAAAVKVFRPPAGRGHVALAVIPFAKVVVDLARGIPQGSFLWLRIQGAQQELGAFRIGLGVRWFVPAVDLELGAMSKGRLYAQSAADLVAGLVSRKLGAWVPAAIAAVLLAVALVRLARRVRAWADAARERRAWSAATVETVRVGWRSVEVAVADVPGVPFTGGILSPWVVFPRTIWESLTPEERSAALAHELAHVAQHHLLLITLVGIARDLFWFVPLVRRGERRVHEACELAADAGALRSGASADVLASALVRAASALRPAPRLATLAATETSLRARLGRLLDGAPPPRLGFQRVWARVLLSLWVAATIFSAVVFGNH